MKKSLIAIAGIAILYVLFMAFIAPSLIIPVVYSSTVARSTGGLPVGEEITVVVGRTFFNLLRGYGIEPWMLHLMAATAIMLSLSFVVRTKKSEVRR